MKKIAVYIADQQDARLKALATTLGITQAELLRQFLEDGLTRREHELHRRAHTPGTRAS
jgi:predicted DNA-binding protein